MIKSRFSTAYKDLHLDIEYTTRLTTNSAAEVSIKAQVSDTQAPWAV